MTDRFSAPQDFKTGVRWEPSDYKPMDQTPYFEYIKKVRNLEKEQGEKK